MKLDDLNKNTAKLGMRQTQPGYHIPTSDSHIEPNEDENIDNDNEFDKSLKDAEIVMVNTQHAPFRKVPNIKRVPNIANIL